MFCSQKSCHVRRNWIFEMGSRRGENDKEAYYEIRRRGVGDPATT